MGLKVGDVVAISLENHFFAFLSNRLGDAEHGLLIMTHRSSTHLNAY